MLAACKLSVNVYLQGKCFPFHLVIVFLMKMQERLPHISLLQSDKQDYNRFLKFYSS